MSELLQAWRNGHRKAIRGRWDAKTRRWRLEVIQWPAPATKIRRAGYLKPSPLRKTRDSGLKARSQRPLRGSSSLMNGNHLQSDIKGKHEAFAHKEHN